ncbi:MAG: FAD-dependent oxidoreductase, partial [Candidatus Delongbacteria bacterium]|nr:FAD-dependent oxidoreductase [Candidatus Delongbacteria bacterium]
MSKYVIIGGVAGGASAAARLRRLDEKAEIILLERGEHISYANCGLPYYLGGVIQERDRLFVQTPEGFGGRFRIDVRVNHEVVRINPGDHSLEIRDLRNDRLYTEQYDKLVLSPGAEPIRPGIPGINDPAIYTLRNVMDIDRIQQHLEKRHPRHAVVVGAGFIGLEMAENLNHRGVSVTIVEMAEQVMTPLDYEMAAEVHQHLKTKQVEFYLKDGVSSFERRDHKIMIHLQSGRIIPTDLVILSIGIRPESRLAKEAGLELGPRGGIKVNAFLQTSNPDIYGVGDAIEYPDPLTGESSLTYLAGPANKQGRMAADNIVVGNTREYHGSIHTAIAKVFDLTVASCGLSEKTLRRIGMPYQASIIHASSHAGYYPDATPLSLKIVFAPETGRLLGAQMIGYQGIDKRIDVLSTMIRHQATVYELTELEHAYAPPYSSAKDPVQMAGYVAENILQGRVNIIHWHQISRLDPAENLLLDVRTPEEFRLGTIEGALNIPVDELRSRLAELPRDRRIVVFCGVGLRGYLACRILVQHGFTSAVNLSGGYKTYQHVTQKQSNEDIFAGDVIA